VAHPHRILVSVNLPDGTTCTCVDIFQRSDGSFGFDLFRRDPEDGRGWFSIGYFGERLFDTAEDAAKTASTEVHWLEEAAPDLLERLRSQPAVSG